MLAGAAALTGAATVGLCLGATCTPSPTGADAEPGGGGGASDSEPLRFGVNGEWHVIRVSDAALKSIGVNTTLIEYLRETCRLTGTKLGCGVGGCGVCTVMLSRRSPGGLEHRHVNSCLLPLFSLHGAHVTTVEGIGSPRDPHPVQTQVAEFHGTPHHSACVHAVIHSPQPALPQCQPLKRRWRVRFASAGSQCGFCTPGMVMSLYTQLAQPDGAAREAGQLEKCLDGNLCRCTGGCGQRLFRAILYYKRSFYQDRLGKNIRNLINRPFSRRLPPAPRRRQELCEEVRMRSHPSIHLWMMMMMMHATRL